jgi:quinol monooxygenase YgiN
MEANKHEHVVLLEIQVKPEAIDEMKAFLQRILPDTRAYDGCQGVDIYSNLDDTGNRVFYERWDSRDSSTPNRGAVKL